jgi:hypothetical protein
MSSHVVLSKQIFDCSGLQNDVRDIADLQSQSPEAFGSRAESGGVLRGEKSYAL